MLVNVFDIIFEGKELWIPLRDAIKVAGRPSDDESCSVNVRYG